MTCHDLEKRQKACPTLQVSSSDHVGGVKRVLGGARSGRGRGRGRGGGRPGAQGRRQEQRRRGGSAGYAGRQRRQHPRMTGRARRRRPTRRQVMARRRMLVRIEVRMRPGSRVQPVAGGPSEFRGRTFRRAIPQYPVDAADRRCGRVAANSWNSRASTPRSTTEVVSDVKVRIILTRISSKI